MKHRLRNLMVACVAAGLLASVFAFGTATAAQQEYTPSVGQEGKDVIWVPTPQALVDKMLDMAKVTPKDYIIDLGPRAGVHGGEVLALPLVGEALRGRQIGAVIEIVAEGAEPGLGRGGIMPGLGRGGIMPGLGPEPPPGRGGMPPPPPPLMLLVAMNSTTLAAIRP